MKRIHKHWRGGKISKSLHQMCCFPKTFLSLPGQAYPSSQTLQPAISLASTLHEAFCYEKPSCPLSAQGCLQITYMQPTPVFLPGESRRQRGLVGYSPWGRKDSDTTETAWHTCMMLTLACLQKGFVRSLFLVVRSESLKDPKETVQNKMQILGLSRFSS